MPEVLVLRELPGRHLEEGQRGNRRHELVPAGLQPDVRLEVRAVRDDEDAVGHEARRLEDLAGAPPRPLAHGDEEDRVVGREL